LYLTKTNIVDGEEGKQVFKKAVIIGCLTISLLLGLFTGNALAETSASVPDPNTGDTAFMLISSALVLLMTPGLAFFYGGFVRSRNILNTLMMSFVLMAIVGVTWVLWGYSG
jgi:ammonium transporter, Amt family